MTTNIPMTSIPLPTYKQMTNYSFADFQTFLVILVAYFNGDLLDYDGWRDEWLFEFNHEDQAQEFVEACNAIPTLSTAEDIEPFQHNGRLTMHVIGISYNP